MDATTWVGSLINGYRGTALVGTAAKLRIADHIAAGAVTAPELAAATGTRVDRLRHVLRALVALGLLGETEDGRVKLTQFGDLLRSDHPGSLRHSAAYAAFVSGPAFDGLLDSLSGGACAFQHRFGTDFYSRLADRPDLAEHFNGTLADPGVEKAVAEVVDLAGVVSVVDAGGGEGVLLAELLRAHRHVRGILFDLRKVLELGTRPLDDPTLAGRYELVTGSFFDTVPAGGEVYFLSRVLANWDDDDATSIVANCRKVMGETDRLMIVEQVMPPRAEVGSFVHLGNLDLLVNFGGHLRTEAEYEALLAAADLRLTGRQFLGNPGPAWAVLEARRI